MSEKLLEIGAGQSPAVLDGGSQFTHLDIDYFAVDARQEEVERLLNGPYKARLAAYAGQIMAADSAELPFGDQSFDAVIMRSVFGEYTMDTELTWSQENAELGLNEAFRVLRDNGRIVVSEENTPYAPATPFRIGGMLVQAGFDDVTVYPCQGMTNERWMKARTRYWAIGGPSRAGGGHRVGQPIDPDFGFLVEAKRPADVEIETFESPIVLPEVWEANRARGWNHPDNIPYTKDGVFQRSARDLPGRTFDLYSMIKVVMRDEEVDLKTYMEETLEGRRPKLFLP